MTSPPHHLTTHCVQNTQKSGKKQKTKNFIKICQVRKNEDLTSDWKKYKNKNKNVSKVRKTFLHSWMKKIHQVFLKHSEGLITAAVLQNKTRKKQKKQKQEEVVFSRNNRSVQEVIDRPPGQGRKNVSIKKNKTGSPVFTSKEGREPLFVRYPDDTSRLHNPDSFIHSHSQTFSPQKGFFSFSLR